MNFFRTISALSFVIILQLASLGLAFGQTVYAPCRQIAEPGPLTKLVADLERPYLYALKEQSTSCSLLLINTQTESVEKSIPLFAKPLYPPYGYCSPALALDYHAGKLYVSQWDTSFTQVFDMATRKLEAPLKLIPHIKNLSAGRPGRLYCMADGYFNILDLATHVVLSRAALGAESGVPDPSGKYCYTCPLSYGDRKLWQWDVRADTFKPLANFDVVDGFWSRLLLCGDGSWLFWNHCVYDRSLTKLRDLGEEIYATTWHGDLAIGTMKIFDTRTGQVLSNLEQGGYLTAVSGDQQKLFVWNEYVGAFGVYDLASIAPAAPPAMRPVPAAGASVSLPLAQLGWDLTPLAVSYDVYFGSDHTQVAAAGKASPQYLGNVTDSMITLTKPLQPEQAYYWRVDEVRTGATVKGPVWSFRVAPFTVSPQAMQFSAYTVAPVAEAALAISAGGGVRSWTANAGAPWIKLSPTQGTTPTTVTVRLDAYDLAPAMYLSWIAINSGDSTVTVPVTLNVSRDGSVTKMLADRERPWIYALVKGWKQSQTSLAFLNTDSERIERVIPIGVNATDLSVSYGEGRLYVNNDGTPLTRVVNLATQREEQPLNLGFAVNSLRAGRPGRLYIQQWNSYNEMTTTSIVNTATGRTIKSLGDVLGSGEIDPTGRFYYRVSYAYRSAITTLTQYNVSRDAFEPIASAGPYYSSGSHLLMSGDGSRLFCGNLTLDRNLIELRQLTGAPLATTLHGDLAFIGNKVVEAATGREVYTLPFQPGYLDLVTVSGDQQKVFFWVNGQIRVIPMSQIADVPGPAIRPTPADGSTISLPLDRLAWDESPRALSYDVYFGAAPAQVAAAGKTSPLYLGNMTSSTLALTKFLKPGQTCFWRVDEVGFNATYKGAVWSFNVSSLKLAPKAIDERVLTFSPVRRLNLALGDSGAALNWTATAGAPWIKLDSTRGATPAALGITLDASGMNPGSYSSWIAVGCGDSTVTVPLRLGVVSAALVRMLPDRDRPWIYAVARDPSTYASYLTFISTQTDQVEKLLPLSFDWDTTYGNSSDMAIDSVMGRLYLCSDKYAYTRVFDLASQCELEPLNLGTQTDKITIGRPGRLYIRKNGRMHFANVQDPSRTPVITDLDWSTNKAVFDPTGQVLYCLLWSNGTSSAYLAKLKVNDAAALLLASSSNLGTDSSTILLSGDGERLFSSNVMLDRNLVEQRTFSEPIYAATLHGDLAIGYSHIFSTRSGQAIYTLPFGFDTRTFAISGDQKKLYYWYNNQNALSIIPMSQIVTIPGPALRPTPADGTTVSLPLNQLAWDISPRALSYDVYFGTDPAQVAAAGKGSPFCLGNVTSASLALTRTLQSGTVYYWRVDEVGYLGATRGAVWSFTTASFTVSPQALDATSLSINPYSVRPRWSARLAIASGNPGHPWTATATGNWLSLSTTRGTSPSTITVSLNASTLPPGFYNSRILVNCDGSTVTVPVSLRVVDADVTKLLGDRDRPYVYALLRDRYEGSDAWLAFVNTTTAQIVKFLPVGRNATDMALGAAEHRLYIANWHLPFTRVVNLDSQSEEAPLRINEFVHNIVAAPPGRLYIANGPGDQYSTGYGEDLYLVRITDGKLLATNDCDGGGVGAAPQAGGCYYFADPDSWGSLWKYDVSKDNFQQVAYISMFDKTLPGVVVSADGSRVFWNGAIYDKNLKKLLTLGESILAVSRDSEMVFSAAQVYATRDGRQLATLPADVKALGLTGDEQKLFTWDGRQLTAVWTQAMQIALAQPQRPQPADQAINIPRYLEQLAWEPSPGTTSYDVYWGTSRDRVASASKSSPEFLGPALGPPFYIEPYQLEPGQSAWWRVDAIGPFGVSKGVVWSYTAVAMDAWPPVWDTWNPEVPFPAEHTFWFDWRSNVSVAGEFLRFELWKRSAGMVAYLGLGWSSAGGSGSKVFYMPLVPSGDDYFIRITSTANPLLVSDTQTFSIQGAAIRLQAPNGGERWPALTKQVINWKANTFFAGSSLQFELWRTSGKVADLGTAYDPDGEGLFYITVPMVPTRGDYRIRAVSVWDPSLYDESDGTITILGSGPERSAVPSRSWLGYQ